MNSNTDAEKSMIGVDMLEQIIAMEMFIKIRIRALKIKNKTFKIGIAVRY